MPGADDLEPHPIRLKWVTITATISNGRSGQNNDGLEELARTTRELDFHPGDACRQASEPADGPSRPPEGFGNLELRSRGAEEPGSRGAEEPRSRGAEEPRSRGAEELIMTGTLPIGEAQVDPHNGLE
jgi:hypothetical protein